MVRIIDGEIVQDDDPRVATMRGRAGAASARRAPGPAGGYGTQPAPGRPSSGFMQTRDLGAGQPQPGVHRPAADPLAGFARMLGIEGRNLSVPAVPMLSLPPRDLPLVYLVVLGLLTLFFGARTLLVAAVLYVVVGRNQPPPSAPVGTAPASHPPRAGPGGPGGRPLGR